MDTPIFDIEISGYHGRPMRIARLEGREELGRPYEFEIDLVSQDDELPIAALVGKPAVLTLRQGVGQRRIHGVLRRMDAAGEASGGFYAYRLGLSPRLALLQLARHNRSFGSRHPMTVLDVIEAVLSDPAGLGFGPAQYSIRVLDAQAYPTRDFWVQYGETDFDFLHRLLEHWGLFYYFEQTAEGERVVFCDSTSTLPGDDAPLPYHTIGPNRQLGGRAVQSITRSVQTVTKSVCLRDYNSDRPQLDLTSAAEVPQGGFGEYGEYGAHFLTPEEGGFFARLRAEEIAWQHDTFAAETTGSSLAPGYSFQVSGHFRASFNQRYLPIAIHHSGEQSLAGAFTSGAPQAGEPGYRNRVTAIVARTPYRSRRITPKPRMGGILPAFVEVDEARPNADRAMIDAQGRYKVALNFDTTDSPVFERSPYLRRVRPYAGPDVGMHFPLLNQTEVMIGWVDGDPDRPLILGAVPNAETVGPVVHTNRTENRLRTASGIALVMNDGPGGALSASETGGSAEGSPPPPPPQAAPPSGGSSGAGSSGSDSSGSGGAGRSGIYSSLIVPAHDGGAPHYLRLGDVAASDKYEQRIIASGSFAAGAMRHRGGTLSNADYAGILSHTGAHRTTATGGHETWSIGGDFSHLVGGSATRVVYGAGGPSAAPPGVSLPSSPAAGTSPPASPSPTKADAATPEASTTAAGAPQAASAARQGDGATGGADALGGFNPYSVGAIALTTAPAEGQIGTALVLAGTVAPPHTPVRVGLSASTTTEPTDWVRATVANGSWTASLTPEQAGQFQIWAAQIKHNNRAIAMSEVQIAAAPERPKLSGIAITTAPAQGKIGGALPLSGMVSPPGTAVRVGLSASATSEPADWTAATVTGTNWSAALTPEDAGLFQLWAAQAIPDDAKFRVQPVLVLSGSGHLEMTTPPAFGKEGVAFTVSGYVSPPGTAVSVGLSPSTGTSPEDFVDATVDGGRWTAQLTAGQAGPMYVWAEQAASSNQPVVRPILILPAAKPKRTHSLSAIWGPGGHVPTSIDAATSFYNASLDFVPSITYCDTLQSNFSLGVSFNVTFGLAMNLNAGGQFVVQRGRGITLVTDKAYAIFSGGGMFDGSNMFDSSLSFFATDGSITLGHRPVFGKAIQDAAKLVCDAGSLAALVPAALGMGLAEAAVITQECASEGIAEALMTVAAPTNLVPATVAFAESLAFAQDYFDNQTTVLSEGAMAEGPTLAIGAAGITLTAGNFTLQVTDGGIYLRSLSNVLSMTDEGIMLCAGESTFILDPANLTITASQGLFTGDAFRLATDVTIDGMAQAIGPVSSKSTVSGTMFTAGT